ncbi:hypothetical protein [Sinomonas atrocyanea]|uniref:hypothetical protein n=1 Tax=Sinomonas atrocyanea TaxID=37927 RepID=UPI003D95A970
MSIDEKDADWRRERDPTTFTVTGGAAFRVDTAALAEAASALASAADATRRIAAGIESARAAVWRGACAGSAAARFDDEASALVRAAGTLRLDLAATRQAVDASARAYADAEAGRASGAEGLQGLARFLVGAAAPGLPWDLVRFAPGRFLAGGLNGAAAVGSAAAASGALGGLGPLLAPWLPAGGPSDRIGVARSQAVGGEGGPSSFAYAAQSLRQAQGAATLEDGSPVPPSSILVERIPRGDGTTALMVTVPGTQTWNPDDPAGGVFDAEGNLHGLASRDSHARQLIERALADQDLKDGDVVVFNAHSQGSLHVFGLLEDEDFRRRYPVAAVTVLGGIPTAFAVPDDVPVLSVRQEDDVVPALSGSAPVPSPNVVDVRTPAHRDRPLAGDVLGLVGAAHSLDRYAIDAQALDRSTDPSVVGYAAVLGAALGGGAAASAAPAVRGDAQTGGQAGQRERFIYTGTDTRTPATPAPGAAPASAAAPPAASGRQTPGESR